MIRGNVNILNLNFKIHSFTDFAKIKNRRPPLYSIIMIKNQRHYQCNICDKIVTTGLMSIRFFREEKDSIRKINKVTFNHSNNIGNIRYMSSKKKYYRRQLIFKDKNNVFSFDRIIRDINSPFTYRLSNKK